VSIYNLLPCLSECSGIQIAVQHEVPLLKPNGRIDSINGVKSCCVGEWVDVLNAIAAEQSSSWLDRV